MAAHGHPADRNGDGLVCVKIIPGGPGEIVIDNIGPCPPDGDEDCRLHASRSYSSPGPAESRLAAAETPVPVR